MAQVLKFDRTYGVAVPNGGTAGSIVFQLEVPAATNSDRFFNSTSPFVAGDVKISKDGGALNNVGTLPTRIGTSPFFYQPLTAAEMQAEDVYIHYIDQDGPAWRDLIIHIRNKWQTAQINADATQIGSNANAVNLTPHGTGYGLAGLIGGPVAKGLLFNGSFTAVSGTQVDLSGAVATTDYYKDAILVILTGTGAGQARVISANTSGGRVTVSPAFTTSPGAGTCLILPGSYVWDVVEGTEPVAADLGNNITFRKIFQFMKRRLFNKGAQNASTQTVYKDDSSTVLVTRAVSDDGTTQNQGKYS